MITYCPKCGKNLGNCYILFDGICSECFDKQEWEASWNFNWRLPTGFNYECPKCGGKFNTPSKDGVKGYCCPFCKIEMKGYK